MTTIRVSSTATVDARPQTVYAIIADYHEGHPRIIPEKHFSDLTVETGGIGAGTIIRFSVRLLGAVRTVRAEISEPSPGRVLVETDLETGARTSFTVEPANGGNRSIVTIETVWTTPGLRGRIERMLAPAALRRIYVEELKMLNEVASSAVRAGAFS